MPTSKLPVDWLDVPESIIGASRQDPRIVCNLRPERRLEAQPKWHIDDSWALDKPALEFLRALTLPCRLMIHFQGYGNEVGTAVVEVRTIGWFDLPRLDFDHPPIMKEVHGCPNFWASFILAMANVPADTPIFAERDPKCRKFFEVLALMPQNEFEKVS